VAIIRDQQVQLPRGSTRIADGDQLLIAAGGDTNVEAFEALASGGD
jgi:Trk K+ transport system NAD-binding subunit